MLSFRRYQVMEHLLPIPLPMATTLLWRSPPCHPGKTEHPMDESSQSTKPVLWRPSTAALFGIDRRGSALCITEVLGAMPRSRDPPKRWFNHPEFHSLMKAELWLVIWAKYSPNSHWVWPPWLPNWCWGQVSSELKSWNCLYICWAPQSLKYKP